MRIGSSKIMFSVPSFLPRSRFSSALNVDLSISRCSGDSTDGRQPRLGQSVFTHMKNKNTRRVIYSSLRFDTTSIAPENNSVCVLSLSVYIVYVFISWSEKNVSSSLFCSFSSRWFTLFHLHSRVLISWLVLFSFLLATCAMRSWSSYPPLTNTHAHTPSIDDMQFVRFPRSSWFSLDVLAFPTALILTLS